MNDKKRDLMKKDIKESWVIDGHANKDQVEKDCSICLSIMVQPVRLECNHTFCA